MKLHYVFYAKAILIISTMDRNIEKWSCFLRDISAGSTGMSDSMSLEKIEKRLDITFLKLLLDTSSTKGFIKA